MMIKDEYPEKKDSREDISLSLKKAGRWMFFPVILVPVILIALIFAAVFLRKGPVVTAGLTPRQVVELYYTSVNTLDFPAITECIDTDAITPLNNRIIGDVISGLATFGEDLTHIHPDVGADAVLYTPAEWLSMGKPPLDNGERVLGLHNLTISSIKDSQYKVTYDYYLTGIPEQGKPVTPFIKRCVDICTLELRSRSGMSPDYIKAGSGNRIWIIVAIDQISEEEGAVL
jgi:hypothetical protein